MFYTYVLKNAKGRLYTGSTKDLRKRLKQHADKLSEYTSKTGPYTLIYYEACLDERDARSREKYLKSGYGKRYLKDRLRRFLSPTG